MEKSLIKKRIPFNLSGQHLAFDVNQSLFSSYKVDIGSQSLLNSLRKNKEINYKKILDLGCGYGLLGIFLKKQNPNSEVQGVDRDLLAVKFAEHNSELNQCEIKSYGSLDYEKVKGKFNLIICNFPAKAGLNAMKKFFWNASKHLEEKGIFATVLVKELKEDFEKIKREEIEVIYEEEKAGYFIYHLRFNKEISFEGDTYSRNEVEYKLDKKKYKMQTARNVPEVEKPSYETLCVNELLKKLEAKEVTIINPFQGHRALSAIHYLRPRKINLISRDLLQIKFAKENLERNNFDKIEIQNEVEKGELLIWVCDKNEEMPIILEKLKVFKTKFTKIIIAAEKKIPIRLIDKINFKILDESKIEKSMAILI